MWDEPQQLNKLSKMLFIFSLLMLLAGAVRYVMCLPVFPLKTVILKQAPTQVTKEEMEQAIQTSVRGNFFVVDLDHTRAAFERLPWVRKASVRRKFPWSLEIELEEHVALARWNDGAFVNTFGEVFMEQQTALTDPPNLAVLPIFAGQPENSVEISQKYAELQEILKPIHKNIAQIGLSPRFAWQVQLTNGLTVDLGREQMVQRMMRFVAVYPYSLAAWEADLKRVDLRYHNGFAAYFPNGLVAKRNSENHV